MIGIGKTGTKKTMGLQCPQAKRLLSPYLDGAVTGTEMLALQNHFAQCPTCHGEYQALRRTQQLLVNIGAAEGSSGSWTEVAAGDFARGSVRTRGPL